VDTIDPAAKIPSPLLEKTMVSQKTDEKEPQGERPGYQKKKKPGTPPDTQPEAPGAKKSGKKPGIDILV